MKTRLLASLTLVLLSGGCRKSGPPYGPKDALKTLKIEPGFRILLFALPSTLDPHIDSVVSLSRNSLARSPDNGSHRPDEWSPRSVFQSSRATLMWAVITAGSSSRAKE